MQVKSAVHKVLKKSRNKNERRSVGLFRRSEASYREQYERMER